MGMDIRNDLAVQSNYRAETTNYETPKVSNNTDIQVKAAKTTTEQTQNAAEASAPQTAVPSIYESLQNRKVLEEEFNNLISQIMPERAISFKIHESTGAIITKVMDTSTKQTVREFPAEKILDMIYSMCSKLGMVVNKKV